MLEMNYGYTYTRLPAIQAFFKANQVERDGNLDQVVVSGLGYRRNRFKGTVHTFFGIDRLLPANSDKQPNPPGTSLIARRQSLSGLTLLLGYDIANTRNQRFFINAGVGSIRYEYSLFRPSTQVVSFQKLLQYAPQASVPSLYVTSGYWEVSLETATREKRRDAGQVVTRFGYRRSFQANPWQSDAYQLVDAPQERISQIYAQVGFYLSRNYNRRKR